MTDQIIPIAMIQAKARAAHARGEDPHGQHFNWHATALATYKEEWERCADQAEQRAEVAP